MKKPSVKIFGNIHSNVYFCRDAILVHLSHGLNRIRWKKYGEAQYSLYFDGNLAVSAWIPACGTCGDSLRRGYGGKITPEECQDTRNRLNSGYQSLGQSIKDISPLLGLLADGDYVVADYDLLPCINGEHFWNGSYNSMDLLHSCYYFGKSGRTVYDSPLCLYPTQRAACLDRDRAAYYRERLPEQNHYPRAVAYYIAGGIALLLDGHHKAAAAASEGEFVRTLVIMHADMSGCSPFMSLNQNRKIGGDMAPMSVNNREGTELGHICTVAEQKIPLSGAKPEFPEEIPQAEWGRMPASLCTCIGSYPPASAISDGMMIPRNQINQEFARLMRHEDPEHDKERAQCLIHYCRIFPDNKWLTPNQRAWLEEWYAKAYIGTV